MTNGLRGDSHQVRVLAVDDEQPILKLVKRCLEPQGYAIQLASDGKEAIDCLNRRIFDIVITDIVMPRMDGYELTRRIVREFSPDVIVMTGHVDRYRYDQLIKIGASDFVQKPFEPEELVLRVHRVLRERRYQEEAMKSHQRLAQSQKLESMGQISAGIVHEIKTPLQYVMDDIAFLKESFQGFTPVLDTLLKICTDSFDTESDRKILDRIRSGLECADLAYAITEVPQAISQINEGVDRIHGIIRAMKRFSHPGRQTHVSADLNLCLQDAVAISKHEWKYRAAIVWDLDDTLPEIPCNPGELTQVFLNLIINACHAISDKRRCSAPGKDSITILTRARRPEVEIRISDTGTGIPETHLDRIYDPFFTTKDAGIGTGQGLAIAHSIIVDRHRGRIDVETEENHGTTFIITLPYTDSA